MADDGVGVLLHIGARQGSEDVKIRNLPAGIGQLENRQAVGASVFFEAGNALGNHGVAFTYRQKTQMRVVLRQ
jgi:hypothetical protein